MAGDNVFMCKGKYAVIHRLLHMVPGDTFRDFEMTFGSKHIVNKLQDAGTLDLEKHFAAVYKQYRSGWP